MSTEFSQGDGGGSAQSSSSPDTSASVGASQTTDVGQAAQPTTPDYGAMITGYGGEDRLKSGMGFYDRIAGPADQFDENDFLNQIASISQDRYGRIADNILNHHAPEMRDRILQQALADDASKQQLLGQLGWNADDYERYRQWVENGQAQPAAQVDPQVKALQDQLAAINAEREQSQQQAQQQERMGKLQEFSMSLMQPVNDFVSKLNLPQGPEGQVAALLIQTGAQGAFAQDPKAMEVMNRAAEHFQNGEYALGAQYTLQLKALVEQHTRPVAEFVGRALTAMAELEQMRAAAGGARREPSAVAQGQPGARQEAAAMAGQRDQAIYPGVAGYGRFSMTADEVRQAMPNRPR